jgi:hypothetical protein
MPYSGGGAVQLKKLLEKWDLTSLKIHTPFLEMEWEPRDEDKTAAWDLYIELITRVSTQYSTRTRVTRRQHSRASTICSA